MVLSVFVFTVHSSLLLCFLYDFPGVCSVSVSTRSSRLTVSSIFNPSSRLANTIFLNVWGDVSTNPVVLCIYDSPGRNSAPNFQSLTSSLLKAVSLSVQIVLGTTCFLNWLPKNVVTVFVSGLMPIFKNGRLSKLTTVSKTCGFVHTFLFSTLPQIFSCNSSFGSLAFFSWPSCLFGNCVSNSPPTFTLVVHFFALVLKSSLVRDHREVLFVISLFV